MKDQFNDEPCRICYGISKTKCKFCFQKAKPIRSLSESDQIALNAFKEQLEYLRITREKLRKFKQTTTGCDDTDRQIIKYLGKLT